VYSMVPVGLNIAGTKEKCSSRGQQNQRLA
jgi:hypothetical protein